MKVYIEDFTKDFDIDPYNISTQGGESWIGDYEMTEYGIHIGELTIEETSPEDIKKLGVCIIYHIVAHGHALEFYNDNQGNGWMFK